MDAGRDGAELLAQIMAVLGLLGASGCATRSVSDTGDEGADAASTTQAGESTGSAGDTDTSDSGDGDGDGDTDTGTKIDFANGDGDGDCDIDVVWVDSEFPYDLCPIPDWEGAPVCFIPPPGVSCADEPYDEACLLDAYICGVISGGDAVICGPYEVGEACCYGVEGFCAVGRPFVVEGQARRADSRPGSSWARSVVGADPGAALDPQTRAALAEAWLDEARSEHASIASFARFALELMTLGAPARLVRACLEAANDEGEHARLAYGLAARFGCAREPGPLPVDGCLAGRGRREIALSLAREGCVAETVSWALLCAARERARDPAVVAALTQIVAEERRHVILAWEALGWIWSSADAPLRAAITAVFAGAEGHVGLGARTSLDGDAERLADHGYLALEHRRALSHRTLAEIVLPAARALTRAAGRSEPRSPWSRNVPDPSDVRPT